jgi:Putative peptidoglycan binding domain
MTPTARFLRPFVAAVVALLALSLAFFAPSAPLRAAASPAAAAVAVPAEPGGLPAGIEQLARYVAQVSCGPSPKPGAVKLAKLLTKTYPNTTYGISRPCGASPNSEHYDGRAIDWMNSHRDKTKAAQAKAVLAWLFADDEAGNSYANARRLGVMYIIWNNKIWGAYSADDGWRAYSTCADHPERGWDTACHRDHMHISLSWEGAMGDTSFWSKKVAVTDFGPCRPKDLNWAAKYKVANPDQCERYPVVKPPKGASANMKTLVTYSGTVLASGSKGTAVKAVQKVIGIKADGKFGAKTKAAVKKWQSAHDTAPSGGVGGKTWRSLLKAAAPKS